MNEVNSLFFRTDGALWKIEDSSGLSMWASISSPKVAHQRIEHAEHVEIVSLLRDRMLEGLAERLARILHDFHGVRHDEAAETGAADDHQFERLNQHVQMTAHRHVAADDAAEGDYKSNYNIH